MEEDSNQSNLKYLDIYAKLTNNRVILLQEDITKEVGSFFSALLLYYDNINCTEDIIIYINCNGGDVTALANMYDVIQMVRSPVKTICIGKAYSAAAFLLASGSKGKRFATKHSDIMIHGIQVQFPLTETADKTDIEIDYKMLESHNNLIMKILARHTNKQFSQIVSDCSRDLYLEPKQAIEYGIVDHII